MPRYLIEFDFIELVAVISCLHPSFRRAQLSRGTMDMIGLHRVPVAFGTDGGDVFGKQVAPDPEKREAAREHMLAASARRVPRKQPLVLGRGDVRPEEAAGLSSTGSTPRRRRRCRRGG